MAQTLKSVVSFTGLQVGVPASLPHGLNWNPDRKVIPDELEADADGFSITADSTVVTVTRGTSAPDSVDVLCTSWANRAFGASQITHLVPQPFVMQSSSGGGGGGGQSLVINVRDYGATGNGTTNDTAAIQAAQNAAVASGKPLYFPPGTYLVVDVGSSFGVPHHALSVLGSHCHWKGDGATIHYDTTTDTPNTSAAIFVGPNLIDLTFDGIYFQGYTGPGENDKAVNCGVAFYIADNVIDTNIINCTFNYCTPALYVSSDTSARALFQNNKVLNSPLAINLPNECKILDNWFHCDEVVSTRSHAIYLFGHCQNAIVDGNHFKNIATQTVQLRSRDSRHSQKGKFVVTNNSFEGDGFNAIWGGADSESLPYHWVIANNTFHNSNSPIQMTGMQGAVIDGNVLTWDYEFIGPSGGIGIQVDSDFASYSPAREVQVTNNLFRNRHPYWATFHVTAEPADGDTITVTGQSGFGASTYTWRTNPTQPGDMQISPLVDFCADTLEQELRGNGSSIISAVLRDQSDAWASRFSTEGLCWIASDRPFTIAATGVAVVCSAINDFSGSCITAINVLNTIGTVVRGNTVYLGPNTGGPPIKVSQSVTPMIMHNSLSNPPTGILSTWNSFPLIDTNFITTDMDLPNVSLSPILMVSSYDAFAIIRDNGQVKDQTATLPFLQGSSGYVPVGDGKARVFMFFGNAADINRPSARLFSWCDGDRFQINFDGSTSYTFNFKETAPTAGAEFNDYTSFLALINAHTGGHFTASNPNVDFFGADPTGNGYVQIKMAVAGVPDVNATIDTSPYPPGYRAAQTCGVTLRRWAQGAQTDCPFLGGAATATKTVVFTPLASPNVPMLVQGVDAASQALNPIAYQADVVPGVAYVITHGVAAGTESFYWRVG